MDNVAEIIEKSDLIIGAGRVVVEALILKKHVMAIGEKQYIGILNNKNIIKAQVSNFGDCARVTNHDFDKIKQDLKYFIEKNQNNHNLSSFIEQYSPNFVMPKINLVYAHALADVIFSNKKEAIVLAYHRVVDAPPKNSKFNIYITKDKLDWQLKNLKNRGFNFITFKDIANGKKVKKPIILTFDDGYKDNYFNLLPLLKKYQAKAVIYCLGDREIKSNIWDEKLGETRLELMNDEQIKICHNSSLIEIASHGLTHQHLPKLDKQVVGYELKQSKINLEKIINDRIVSFAYPYGDYSERECDLAHQAGYCFALGTVNGPLKIASNYYKIRRIQIFPNSKWIDFWKKTSGFYLRLCKLKGKDF